MDPEILERSQGKARRLTLNRPAALNALTRTMVHRLTKDLAAYEADPEVTLIILDAAGDRAFCAGGDVARLYKEGVSGNFDYCLGFWRELYALVAQIADMQTPIVVLMDGIVMGGGAGLGAHARHRVVTERTKLAMPECAIGLVPDVGICHLLGAAPQGAGHYVALTGARLNADATIAVGLADCVVPSDDLEALVKALMAAADPTPLKGFATRTTDANTALPPEPISAFAGDAAGLEARLSASQGDWSARALKALRAASPLSLALTRQLLADATAGSDLQAALERDLSAAQLCLAEGDFLEGVRAAIIEKDGTPNWKPLPAQMPQVSRLPIYPPAATMTND